MSQTSTSNNLIRYLQLPAGISKTDVIEGKQATRKFLHDFTLAEINKTPRDSAGRNLDIIIVFTAANGEPILPDAEKMNASIYPEQDRSENEISFSFNSLAYAWSATEIDSLNHMIADIYPAITELIGRPFFNIIVNVSKDPTISYAGTYNSSINEITLPDLKPEVFCHEIIHAFRDDYIMGLPSYEEGMTRAAEIEVTNRLEKYTSYLEFHKYDYDHFYEGLNTPGIACRDGNFFHSVVFFNLRYSLSSYAWAKAFLEDHEFFKRFNDSLYERTVSEPDTRYTLTKLRQIFANIKPIVEGLPNAAWYDRQYVLKADPTEGYNIYQRVNLNTMDYFQRNIYGFESPQPGAEISWQVLDNNSQVLGSGSALTGLNGFISYFSPFLENYFGRIKVVASVQSPEGLIIDTAYSVFQYPVQGVFGIVDDANTGSIEITPLDTAMGTLVGSLTRGAFNMPDLENARGRFRYVFSYPDGRRVSRIFTKDRSVYFLRIKNDSKTYWVGSMDHSWHNPLNWSGGLVPDQYADVIINSALPNSCIINQPAICRSFTLANNVQFKANHNLTILH